MTEEERKARNREYGRRWRERNRGKALDATRKWNAKNPEKRANIAAQWRAANPRYGRQHALRTKYGLTIDAWEQMFNAQHRRCAICQRTKGKWDTDHDHATGKVRAILCSSCNKALGLAQDNPDTLRKMALYLEAHAAL
jgi:hypothetical protein